MRQATTAAKTQISFAIEKSESRFPVNAGEHVAHVVLYITIPFQLLLSGGLK